MATTPKPKVAKAWFERRIVLQGIRWRTYESLLKDLEHSNVRLTYDRGSLEIMSPGQPHEQFKKKLGRLVDAMTEELEIEIIGGGSTTFRRELKEKGLEPDECYWIANAARVLGKEQVDLDVDPPPDLAIEVEKSRGALNKLNVYAGLGFPEVWRFNGKTIRVHVLQPDGTYVRNDRSPTFPFLDLNELVSFVQQGRNMFETTWIREFRVWVRETLLPRYRRAADEGPHL